MNEVPNIVGVKSVPTAGKANDIRKNDGYLGHRTRPLLRVLYKLQLERARAIDSPLAFNARTAALGSSLTNATCLGVTITRQPHRLSSAALARILLTCFGLVLVDARFRRGVPGRRR